MSNSILCAVDISNGNHDLPVLKRAAQLAELDGARLDVVTVIPDFGEGWVSGFFKPDYHDEATKHAQEALVALCEEAFGPELNAKVRHVVATGTAYQQVLDVAEKAGADMIVIGSHTPELRDYLLGPNAARVVRHSSCSVHVVR
ncbi:universal stress protein [Shimia sediminis]|uniref:universal stress protein n=1 Tax=Shimia sediminis TaxID=2497945 RepID=UPI000F8CB875|nr:universal stress protein [Shimia sediminis]